MLTWGVAYGDVKSLLPMSQDTLNVIKQEALMISLSVRTIRNFSSAIEDQHRQLGYNPPMTICGGDFCRYSKAVASAKGMPSRLLFPIGVHHIRKMLELGDLTLNRTQNLLMTVTIVGTVTVMCMQMNLNELDRLQICNASTRGSNPRAIAPLLVIFIK